MEKKQFKSDKVSNDVEMEVREYTNLPILLTKDKFPDNHLFVVRGKHCEFTECTNTVFVYIYDNEKTVNSHDELVKQNEMLKKALNTILNLGRPNGDYAAAFSKTKTIANNALNTLTVKEDGNNEAKAL